MIESELLLPSLSAYENSCEPLLAIVPRFEIASSRVIPIPESKMVRVLSFSFVIISMFRS